LYLISSLSSYLFPCPGPDLEGWLSVVSLSRALNQRGLLLEMYMNGHSNSPVVWPLGPVEIASASASWNEFARVGFLLAACLGECSYTSNDTGNHEKYRHNGPHDSPALRRASIFLGKDTGIGAVHFAENQIIALSHQLAKAIESSDRAGLQYPRRCRGQT
jgi:hypothetical protein